MKRLQITYSIILLILSSIYIFGQDTTYFDSKINYYSKNGDLIRFDKTKRYKGHPKVDYAREVIQLENDSFKVQNCYYYDNIRYTNWQTTHYKIIDDSILITDNQKWIFKRINDSLTYVSHDDGEYIETGKVIVLIPLIKHGDFFTYNIDDKLLLIEYYNFGNCIRIESPQKKLNDSVYTIIDTRPKFPDKFGDLDEYIAKRFRYPETAIESSIQGKVFIQFVVTSVGEVTNVKVLRGVDPTIDREAIKVVANLPDFEPGKINCKNVNAYYVIPIDIKLK